MNQLRNCQSLLLKLYRPTLLIESKAWKHYNAFAPAVIFSKKLSVKNNCFRYIHQKRSSFDFSEEYSRLDDGLSTDSDYQKRPSRNVSRSPGFVEKELWLRGSAQDSNYQTDILRNVGETSHSSEKKESWSYLFNMPVKLGGIKHKDGYIPNVIDKLSDLPNLDARLLKNFNHYGWEIPSAVQRYSMPILLDKLDLLAAAQTGSGKTLAFLIPLLQSIISAYPEKAMKALAASDYTKQYPLGLILAPTQELCQQIHLEACKLSQSTCCSPVAFFGGQNINIQIKALDTAGCHLAVATPGRFKDMLNRGYLSLEFCKFLILDEADRMLDMGFEPQIREIIENPAYKMPGIADRQTCMFSATFSGNVRKLALDHLRKNEAVLVVVGEDGPMAKNINLSFQYGRDESSQRKLFLDVMKKIKNDRVLVFCNYKRAVDMVDRSLYNQGIRSIGIHGGKSRVQRDKAMTLFRSNKANVLVATDVASRGLDIPNVKYVVLYDLPQDITDFVHRAGRTGRMGSEGHCITICNSRNVDKDKIKTLIEMLDQMKVTIPKELKELNRDRY